MRQDSFYDYYELLGIPMAAPRQDVLAAYNKMRLLYGNPQSNASEFFSEQELQELKEILEEGFKLLSHPLKRTAYNEALKKVYPEKYSRSPQMTATASASATRASGSLPLGSDFDGFFLRQIREQMNVSLDELSDVTRIKPHYLNALEQNDYGSLPAPVFVRGFVSQVAKVYGLDEKKICDAYMNRLKESRDPR